MALTFQSAEALVQLLMGKEKEVEKWLPKCYRISRVFEGKRQPFMSIQDNVLRNTQTRYKGDQYTTKRLEL